MERPARDLHGHHCIAALIRHAVIEKAAIDRELEKVLLATTDGILEYARWIEEIAPGFIALIILALRGETIEPVVRSGFWPSSRQATIHTGAS